MIAGPATRALSIIVFVAAWGRRSEPDAPGTAANLVPRTATEAASRPVAAPAIDKTPDRRVTKPRSSEKPERLEQLVEALRQAEKSPPLRARAISTGDAELDPLVTFLHAYFAEGIKAGKVLVIEDRTSVDRHVGSPQDYLGSVLAEASDKVPAGMIRDHVERNRQSHAIWPELGRHLPVRSPSREVGEAIFTDGPDANWERFYKRFADATGLITISRVGLNRDKDLALFYMGVRRGSLNGEGQLHVLKKEGDEWVEQPIRIG